MRIRTVAVPLIVALLSATPSIAEDVEFGGASWYNLPGNKMANGQMFNPNRIAFAHKTLPLGSLVSVTNLKNGKTICGPVTDRGPYIKGRIIDATKPAARSLGYFVAGTTKVSVKRVRAC